MHHQLFIPHGLKRVSAIAALEGLRLRSEIEGAEFVETRGPEELAVSLPEGVVSIAGVEGHLVYWPQIGAVKGGFDLTRQTWRPAVPCGDQPAGRYWIGIDRERPPTPAELARPYRHAGTWVKLGDNQQWLLPKEQQLPRDMILADDGHWRWELQREFWDFSLEADRLRAVFASKKVGDSYDEAELATFVRRAIALNYRALPEVISQLRLLNTGNLLQLGAYVLLDRQLSEGG